MSIPSTHRSAYEWFFRHKRHAFGLMLGASIVTLAGSASFEAALAQNSSTQTETQVAPLPLTGPPYLLLEQANEAISSGNYQEAISALNEAIRQRPDSIQLRKALVAALQESGRNDEALQTAKAASNDTSLTPSARAEMASLAKPRKAIEAQEPASAQSEAVSPLKTDPAYQAADAAYEAYDDGDYRQAVTLAEDAVRLAPDNAGYQTLLNNAEAALKLENEAANRPVISAADRAANAAYAAQRSGNIDAALSFAQQAVKLSPNKIAFRLLVIDLLNRQGNNEAALSAVNHAIDQFGASRALLQRRGFIEQSLGDNQSAQVDFANALTFPGSGERQLRIALSAAAMENGDPDTAYHVLQPLGDDRNYTVWLTRGKALAAMENYTAAETAFDEAMALARTDRDKANVAIALLDMTNAEKGGRTARAMLNEDRDNGLLSPLSRTETAYLAARLGDRQLAYDAFSDAYSQGDISGAQLIDAAYAAKHNYHNEQAISLLKRAIDEADAGVYKLDEQQRFNIRREISDLDRQWGGNIALTYGSSGISDGFLSPPSSAGEVLQLGSEIYWRPPVIGNRDGRTVDLFLRQFTTLYDSLDGPVGTQTTQGAAGIRVKPFSDVSFILEAAKYFKIGRNSIDDFLLRAAISDGFNTDLMPGLQSWWTGQYYGEIGRYLASAQNFASGNARFGRSYRVGDIDSNLIVTPFVGIAADYNNTYATDTALGAGPGLHLRYWFNETKYKAPTSHIDLDVQYRLRLAGDDRANGWFVILNTTF